MEIKIRRLRTMCCVAAVVMILLLASGCVQIARILPPGSGTIFKHGSHPEYYGDSLAPTVYFVGIQSDKNPRLSWTWCVDKEAYAKYQVGDYINVFGVIYAQNEEGETP